MSLSNSEVAAALELSHSSVSRMRTGERVASVDTLQRLVTAYDADPRRVLETASKAVAGERGPWVELLGELFGDDPGDLKVS